MSGLPRFDFYSRDWLTGTRKLTLEQSGLYAHILALLYEAGEPIPADPRDLAKSLGVSSRMIARILPSLIAAKKLTLTDDGMLTNQRFEIEMERARRRQANGRKPRSSSPSSTPAPPPVQVALHPPVPGGVKSPKPLKSREVENHPAPSPAPTHQSPSPERPELVAARGVRVEKILADLNAHARKKRAPFNACADPEERRQRRISKLMQAIGRMLPAEEVARLWAIFMEAPIGEQRRAMDRLEEIAKLPQTEAA